MPANNDSSCVETLYKIGLVKKVKLVATFDTGDGSFADHVLTSKLDGFLIALITKPTGSPTDNYDITLTNALGVDVLQGVGANRDTANAEQANIVFSGTTLHPVVTPDEVLTLKIANNTDVSASAEIWLYVAPASV